MNNKSCTFAGHRNAPEALKSELIATVTDLVDNKGVTTFFVGNNGSFDSLGTGAVRVVKRKHKNVRLVLVVPKMSSTIEKNKDYYSDMFDEILIPAESDAAHYKAMITVRNRWLVDNSDYIITYIRNKHGGAYNTYNYAKKQNITIVEL